ncbi:MAG: hypothetical protein LBB65_00035 [Burkholderiales bacterium]|jgi:hypothetical protein|nr:hypothetical protein [Burkholderiales bacterium]
MNKEIIILNTTESLFESVASDVVTFAFLALCIWFSYEMGGGWWTFFTCTMFLISVSSKLFLHKPQQTKLKSKKEAIAWANSLPDDAP